MAEKIIGYTILNHDWDELKALPEKERKEYEEGKEYAENFSYICDDNRDMRSFPFHASYDFGSVAKIEVIGNRYRRNFPLRGTDKIKIVKIYKWREAVDLLNRINNNVGVKNVGYNNTGNNNTGRRNTGNHNYFYGSDNAGNCNTGNYNTGDCNTGSNNAGDFNLGTYNTGNYNTGNYNTGSFNLGNYNAGSWNLSNFNVGCFNTEEPKITLFDKVTDMTLREWESTDAWRLLKSAGRYLAYWKERFYMNEKEIKENPESAVVGGYLGVCDFYEGYNKWWDKLTEEEKEIITNIPNFCKNKFKEITGIDVTKDNTDEPLKLEDVKKVKGNIVTAQQQGQFLKCISAGLKHFETVTGYLMIDADKNLSLIPEGREYHEAIKEGWKEIQEIFDVKDRVYFMEDAPVEEFIEEHGLRDYKIK